MPRNSNGDYSLPAGNPVVTGTTISSTWANTSLADIANALTDSLSRSGDGGMTAPLFLDDGAIGAPALAWGNETTSGLYRAGAGDFRYAIGGADKIQITTNGIKATAGVVATPGFAFITDVDTGIFLNAANDLQIAAGGQSVLTALATGLSTRLVNGAAATPSISFFDDPNTGIYSPNDDEIAFTTAGVFAGRFIATQQLAIVNGVVGAPSYTFDSDRDTGMYRLGVNNFGFAAGGVSVADISAAIFGINSTVLQVNNGSAAGPSYSFLTEAGTGMYKAAAFRIGFSCGGNLGFTVDGIVGITSIFPHYFQAGGTAGAPAISFTGDTDTGIYLDGANSLGFSAGGTQRFAVTAANVFINAPLEVVANSSNSVPAGGASALPATPQGYMAVVINGTQRRIPYYPD